MRKKTKLPKTLTNKVNSTSETIFLRRKTFDLYVLLCLFITGILLLLADACVQQRYDVSHFRNTERRSTNRIEFFSIRMSLAKQNYAKETEEAVNAQIKMELQASHTYLAIAAYFQRDTVALPGLRKFFQEASKEEREHAEKLIEYQNMRGGIVALGELKAVQSDWVSARNAVEVALQMEKEVNKSLLALHHVAEAQNDPQLCDFVEGNFLQEQVESIKELSDMLTTLSRVDNDGIGLFLFDRELLEKLK